jgi:hypothetical protein
MVACLETAAFGLVFVAMGVLPWRWFYVVQLADAPSSLGSLPLPLRILSRVAALVVGVGVLGLVWLPCQ